MGQKFLFFAKSTEGHATSAFSTPWQKLGLRIVQNWVKFKIPGLEQFLGGS